MLLQIRDFLRQQDANITEIAKVAGVDLTTTRRMLDVFIRKGKVCKLEGDAKSCSNCQQCSPIILERYSWQETDGFSSSESPC